jgi:hypothetical protein
MENPTIYVIRPKAVWDVGWLERVLTRDEFSPTIRGFKSMGYHVEIKDGCTVKEFQSIIRNPNTNGVFIYAHGSINAIELDGVKTKTEDLYAQKITHTNYGGKPPFERGDIKVSPNLQFFGFAGCKLNENTIKDFAFQLRLKREEVFTAKLDKDGNFRNYQISEVLFNIYSYLLTPKIIKTQEKFKPINAFVPYVTIPKEKPIISNPGDVKKRKSSIINKSGKKSSFEFRPSSPVPGSLRWMAQGLNGTSSSGFQTSWRPQQSTPTPGSLRWMAQGLGGPPQSFYQKGMQPQQSIPTPGSLRWMAQGLSGPSSSVIKTSWQTQQTTPTPGSLRWMAQGLSGPSSSGLQTSWQPRQTTPTPGSLRWMAQGLGGSPSGFQTSWRPQQSPPVPGSLRWMAQGLSGPSRSGFQTSWRPQQTSPMPGSLQWMAQGLR